MNRPLHEYDIVRVVQLLDPSRKFSGTDGFSRPPQVGDEGTVVCVYDPQNFAVEMVEKNGMTIWLADFLAEELQQISN